MLLLIKHFKDLFNEKYLIKLFLHFLVIFIFTIIYYNHNVYFLNVNNLTETIYMCLSNHFGLGLGDVLPKLEAKNSTGVKILICHITCVILLLIL